MAKIDFKKDLRHLYGRSSKEFVPVEVPRMNFLMLDGHGDPNTAVEYQQALEALYAVAFKIKFISKKELAKDYVVPPLEGLWWAQDMEVFISTNKDQWDWTMMIMQPEWITVDMFKEACKQVEKSKNPSALSKLRLEEYQEGLSLQIMHIGSYDDESPTLERLHNDFIPQNGYIMEGKHHEIYLSDPRKVLPEKLKTILRQPVKKVGK